MIKTNFKFLILALILVLFLYTVFHKDPVVRIENLSWGKIDNSFHVEVSYNLINKLDKPVNGITHIRCYTRQSGGIDGGVDAIGGEKRVSKNIKPNDKILIREKVKVIPTPDHKLSFVEVLNSFK